MSQADGLRKINGLKQQPLVRMSSGSGLPKDLLHRYMSANPFSLKLQEETAEEGDIELSLGLSLNGRFGVDPRAKKLTRSSSIPDFIDPTSEKGGASVGHVTSTNIVRTCSLPTEAEEQWRKRKEMQTQRRMEVKRKRLEKKGSLKTVKDTKEGNEEDNDEEGKRENVKTGNHHKKLFKNFNGGLDCPGLEVPVPRAEAAAPLSQGSNGSQGSGSSGITDSESQPFQGMVNCTEARSPVSAQSLTECEQKRMRTSRASVREESGSPAWAKVVSHRSDKTNVAKNRSKEEIAREVLGDMPCVSTKGDGPKGKKIEGFLYRYGKGEEVRIVCVCHGNFLSPAEFVKHAGGGGVAQPLKHIVVSSSPLL